jgi:hypothetical protein
MKQEAKKEGVPAGPARGKLAVAMMTPVDLPGLGLAYSGSSLDG